MDQLASTGVPGGYCVAAFLGLSLQPRSPSLNYLAFAFVVVAVVGTAALARRHLRRRAGHAIDAGTVSQQWLAESRREEEA